MGDAGGARRDGSGARVLLDAEVLPAVQRSGVLPFGVLRVNPCDDRGFTAAQVRVVVDTTAVVADGESSTFGKLPEESGASPRLRNTSRCGPRRG